MCITLSLSLFSEPAMAGLVRRLLAGKLLQGAPARMIHRIPFGTSRGSGVCRPSIATVHPLETIVKRFFALTAPFRPISRMKRATAQRPVEVLSRSDWSHTLRTPQTLKLSFRFGGSSPWALGRAAYARVSVSCSRKETIMSFCGRASPGRDKRRSTGGFLWPTSIHMFVILRSGVTRTPRPRA